MFKSPTWGWIHRNFTRVKILSTLVCSHKGHLHEDGKKSSTKLRTQIGISRFKLKSTFTSQLSQCNSTPLSSSMAFTVPLKKNPVCDAVKFQLRCYKRNHLLNSFMFKRLLDTHCKLNSHIGSKINYSLVSDILAGQTRVGRAEL